MTTQKDKARVCEIIEDMGGPAELARKLSPKKGKQITTAIVSNWTYRGSIPRRHWDAMIELSGGWLTTDILHGRDK